MKETMDFSRKFGLDLESEIVAIDLISSSDSEEEKKEKKGKNDENVVVIDLLSSDDEKEDAKENKRTHWKEARVISRQRCWQTQVLVLFVSGEFAKRYNNAHKVLKDKRNNDMHIHAHIYYPTKLVPGPIIERLCLGSFTTNRIDLGLSTSTIKYPNGSSALLGSYSACTVAFPLAPLA